jgi:hypothetical protein
MAIGRRYSKVVTAALGRVSVLGVKSPVADRRGCPGPLVVLLVLLDRDDGIDAEWAGKRLAALE